jgi:DNA invertase Pin-like site-specific DNA recombinase
MARPRKLTADPTAYVAYVRVSTSEQAESGLGLAAQRAAVEAEADRRGWTLVEVFQDAGISGKSTVGRPGLAAALAAVESGQAAGILVSKLDRLSRSLADFASLMAQAKNEGWNLVALDLGVDLSTPAGEFLASVMASAAQWERRIIGARTKDALAVKRAAGVRLGRPTLLAQGIVERIVADTAKGMTPSAIARAYTSEGVLTATGKSTWYPSTIKAVLASQAAAA